MTTTKHVLGIHEVDRTMASVVGGKGANLGELARLAGLRVPAGFCVTTGAFRRMLAAAPAIGRAIDRLASLAADDRDAIRELAGELRRIIEATAIPDDVRAAITDALAGLGADDAHAVLSLIHI